MFVRGIAAFRTLILLSPSDVEYSRSSPQYSEQSAELIWSTALNYWALIEGAARVRRDTGKDC